MENRRSRYGLASTVSIGAAALAAGMPATPAMAQDPMVVTLDGGVAFGDFSKSFFGDKGGDTELFDTDVGFFGSVAVSRKISDTWDWRLSGTVLGFGDNTFSTVVPVDPPDFAVLEISQAVTAVTAEAGMGRNHRFGESDLRLGFGVLATRHEQSIDKGVDFFDESQLAFDITYRGIGPRLSADLLHPVSADGKVKLMGGASIAPTVGSFRFATEGPGSDSFSEDGSALLSSAYLGVAVERSETTDLRAGLRFDRIDGEVEGGNDNLGIAGNPATTTSAFVGLSIQF